ncbi:MAG: hypothetical protein R2724_29770 [Bryobacterales bacterium]
MLRLACGLAALVAAAATLFAAEVERKKVPVINEGGVVNAAGFMAAPDNFVAPGSIIAIFGDDLALRTRAVSLADLDGGRLPTSLGGVWVILGSQRIPLYYVSPTQINAQVPFELAPRAGDWSLIVSREGLATAVAAQVKVVRAAPGLFPVALHADYRVVGRGEIEGSEPLEPGELAILFGTGFGPVVPVSETGELPPRAAGLVLPLDVWLADERLPPESILYAGQAPGFAGLCQVNVLLPNHGFAEDPEVRVEIDGLKSPTGFRLAIE